MTRLEILTAIKTRLETWGTTASIPVYERHAMPAEPPTTGYLSFVPEWGEERQESRGGPVVMMESVMVVSMELFLPRGQMGTAYGHEDAIADLWRSYQSGSLHMVGWRAEEPEQLAGGPFFQLNFYLTLERHEDQDVAA